MLTTVYKVCIKDKGKLYSAVLKRGDRQLYRLGYTTKRRKRWGYLAAFNSLHSAMNFMSRKGVVYEAVAEVADESILDAYYLTLDAPRHLIHNNRGEGFWFLDLPPGTVLCETIRLTKLIRRTHANLRRAL